MKIAACHFSAAVHDIEQRKSPHGGGVVEGEPVPYTSTTVVPCEEECSVTECGHDLNHVGRHRTLGVIRVVGRTLGLAAVAIAAKVRTHHRIVLRKRWRDLLPHAMVFGVPVK